MCVHSSVRQEHITTSPKTIVTIVGRSQAAEESVAVRKSTDTRRFYIYKQTERERQEDIE